MARWTTVSASLLATLLLFGGLAPLAHAADIPAYDITTARTRLVTAHTAGMATQLYSDIPVYEQIPAGTLSFSTPNVLGSTAYQYTFDAGGTGYLTSMTLPSLTASQIVQQAGSKGYVIQAARDTTAPIQFPVGYSGPDNMASSQASLSTGPYVAGAPDGTQYQAIAVGKYLHTWAATAYPTNGSAGGTVTDIPGNPGNTDFQIDTSPLITPPVTVSGLNLSTGNAVTWQSPTAVVGSWDGGLVATPLYVPGGDGAITQYYTTSQPASLGGVAGTPQFPNDTGNITSDPTWVGNVPGVGADCVAFGVSGSAHPRVVLFDVATGHYKDIGLGTIGAGVSDATLWDAATGTLFVQDLYGALYAFGLTGTLKAHYWPSTWTNASLLVGRDMALIGSTLYAVGGGGNVLGAFNTSLVPLHLTSAYGPGVSSPAGVTDPSGQTTVVISNSQGALWLKSDGAAFATPSNTYQEALATPTGSAWIGYVPDAGPAHDLVGWTNSDPAGHPALVVYVPMPYTMRAGVSSPTINSGHSVTVYGSPLPQTVTAHSTYHPGAATSPVGFRVTTSAGATITGWNSMSHVAQGQWQGVWTPPANTTQQPITYTITVTGINELDQTASATTSVTVEPTAAPATQTSHNSGTLTLACGFGAGGLPITVPDTCTLPAWTSGNPAAWFVANPQFGAKFGDTIQTSVTVPSPALPNLPGLTITAEQLHVTVPYTAGVPNMPGAAGDNPNTGQSLYNPNSGTQYWQVPTSLTLAPTGSNSLTATGYLIESWAGYPPDLANANTGNTYSLSANWTLKTSYRWTQTLTHCAPPTAQGTTPACTTSTVTHTATTTTSGTASAPITVNGTDYYAIATPMD